MWEMGKCWVPFFCAGGRRSASPSAQSLAWEVSGKDTATAFFFGKGKGGI